MCQEKNRCEGKCCVTAPVLKNDKNKKTVKLLLLEVALQYASRLDYLIDCVACFECAELN